MAFTQISTDGIKDGTISSADLADQSVTLAKLPHGTSSNDGKFLRANNGADPTFETVTSIGGNTGVDFNDNVKVRFGTGNDLEIYHSGSTSYIKDTGTGNLRLATSKGEFRNAGDTETLAAFIENGAVELYYDNSKKFETITEGAKITSSGSSHGLFVYHSNGNEVARLAHGGSGDEGVLILKDSGANTVLIRGELGQDIDITTGGDFDLEHDSAKLRLGAGNDLQIYHDGTSNIFLANSGDLNIRMNNSENAIVARQNGAAELYYNNVKKLETTSDGVKITAAEGGEAILSIHADEGDDNGDQYRIRVPNNDGFRIETGSSHETALKLDVNAGVELYYDNSKKFETRSGGLGVFGHIEAGDDNKLMLGDSNDLQIYHDGSNSHIAEAGTGVLKISGSAGVYINKHDNTETMAAFLHDAGVELYHNNNKHFETATNGGIFRGTTWTAVDNCKIAFGTGDDLQIYHDGTNSIIKNTYEDLYINCESDDLYLKAADNIFMQPQAGETGINIHGNGAVELYYDNSRKLATTNTGVKITDNFLGVNVDSASGTFGGRNAHLAMGDTDTGVAQNGDGQLELWANNQEIVNVDTGSVSIYKDLRPHANNNNDLGSSSNRWRTVFSNNSLNTSDKNLKNTIVDSDLGLSFINKLRPVSYKWKKIEGENPDDKTHYGLIAQEIETALASEGKTLDNFAGVYKPDDYKEDGTGGAMAIAVSELISPLIKAIQELSAEVAALKGS